MQNHPEDELFDNRKYHFPLDALAHPGPKQPGLEVAQERDEQSSAPGLQPVLHDEQKYAVNTRGALVNGAPPYRTHGTAHADELTSQGLQAIPPLEPDALPRSQPQFPSQTHSQNQWPESAAYQHYGQSFQTLPSSQISGYSTDNPTYGSPENQYLNPYATTSPSSSWVKDEHRTQVRKDGKRRRWVLWAVGGAVLLLIGAGAVLGGVLGSRAGRYSHPAVVANTTSNGTIPDTPSSTPASSPVKSIRAGSRLAVTGYRTKTDYSIRLFYQDKDNQLRFVDKESASANWTESKATVLDNLPYQPKINGSIAAGSYLFDDPAPKIEFFYEDKDGIVRGQNFNFEFENGTIPLKGEGGSINFYPLQIAGNTKISSFFPYLVSQDADNSIRWTVMHGQNASNLSAPWWVNDTEWDVKASKGGGMVVLPIAQNVRNAGGVVYRSAEGMLSVKIHDESDPSNEEVAWRKGALSKEIPSNASIGAFSVGRPYDNNNQVNTYILYQDDDGTIQVVWQDDDAWKGPETYDALKGADLGTDIACLTPGTYDAANIEISREQDMNRCFFMSGGLVKEVWFNGSAWSITDQIAL
ncbi:hypothetical protein F5Y05DRAFT_366437 [Hypoxylon sp. FL0543]|nr:hypothetical protein F5Y05DRAFT_366437 [Hypoxylon sp. FL0543]